jgi:hypothetical protein
MAEARNAARMTRLIAQWRKSGESGASFARRHQVSPWKFWYWSRKLSSTPAVAAAPAARFVPVRVTGEGAEPVLEIVLRSGERIQVRSGASAELLRVAVSALQSRC